MYLCSVLLIFDIFCFQDSVMLVFRMVTSASVERTIGSMVKERRANVTRLAKETLNRSVVADGEILSTLQD